MNFPLNLLISLLFIYGNHNRENGFERYSISIPGSSEQIQFTPIEGGKFTMGNNAKPSEAPEHEAEVSDFWMSTHEITWQQYELFVRWDKDSKLLVSNEVLNKLGIDGISSATQPYTDMSFGMGKDDFPAVNITQYAALSYCKWLSALTGEFYRLPTESEWEYAASGGKKSDGHQMLQVIDDYAWFKDNSESQYHKVGLKEPNLLGLYDILGNAAEWTMDGFAAYPESKGKDFWKIPGELYPRVVRGGSWTDKKEDVTFTARVASKPGWKIRDPQLPKSRWWHTNAPFVGFRIIRPRIQPVPGEINKYWLKVFEDYN